MVRPKVGVVILPVMASHGKLPTRYILKQEFRQYLECVVGACNGICNFEFLGIEDFRNVVRPENILARGFFYVMPQVVSEPLILKHIEESFVQIFENRLLPFFSQLNLIDDR